MGDIVTVDAKKAWRDIAHKASSRSTSHTLARRASRRLENARLRFDLEAYEPRAHKPRLTGYEVS